MADSKFANGEINFVRRRGTKSGISRRLLAPRVIGQSQSGWKVFYEMGARTHCTSYYRFIGHVQPISEQYAVQGIGHENCPY
jgi:hypothetical protein